MSVYLFVQLVSKVVFLLAKKIVAVFPRGSKKRKYNNDDKHDNGQEKRRPATCVEGMKKNATRQLSSYAKQVVCW